MAFVPQIRKGIQLLLYGLLLILPLGQLLQYSFPNPSIRLYLADIVVLLLAFLWILSRLLDHKDFKAPPLTLPIILFIGVSIFSLLFSIGRYTLSEIGIGSLYLIRWMSYSALYFIVYEYKNRSNIIFLLAVSGTVSALFGIVQYFLYPNLRNLEYAGWDPHEYRIFGTFLDSGFAGLIFVLTLILVAYLYMSKDYSFNKAGLIVSGFISYLALALTYARSSYLAFVVSFFALSILNRTYKIALFSTLLLAATIIVLPRPSQTSEGVKLERTSTISARGRNYIQTLAIIRSYPLFGVGFNTLRYENIKRGNIPQKDQELSHSAAGSDSSFLFVAATTGIVGLASYIFLWIRIVAIELERKKRNTSAFFVLPTVGALLISSLFLNSLFYIWVLVWLWMLLGVSHSTSDGRFVSSAVSSLNFKSIFSFIKRN